MKRRQKTQHSPSPAKKEFQGPTSCSDVLLGSQGSSDPSACTSTALMMRCQGKVNGVECGRDLSPYAKLCADCGTPVIFSGNCSCGTCVRSDQKFCHNCGILVHLVPSVDAPPSLCAKVPADNSSQESSELSQKKCLLEKQTLSLNLQASSPQSPDVQHYTFGQSSSPHPTPEEGIKSGKDGGSVGASLPENPSASASDPACLLLGRDLPTGCDDNGNMSDKGVSQDKTFFSQYAGMSSSQIQKEIISHQDQSESNASNISISLADTPIKSANRTDPKARDETEIERSVAAKLSDSKKTPDKPVGSALSKEMGETTSTGNIGLNAPGKGSSEHCNTAVKETSTDQKQSDTGLGDAMVPENNDSGNDKDNSWQVVGTRKNKNKTTTLTECEADANKKTSTQKSTTEDSKTAASSTSAGVRPVCEKTTADNRASYAAVTKLNAGQRNTRMSGVGQRNVNSLRSESEKVTVVFHVIISGHFELEKGDEAFIWHDTKGDAEKQKMQFGRECKLGWMFEGQISMTRDKRNSGFRYKYVIRKRSGDFVWEELQKYSYSHVNRDFKIPANCKSAGEWSQYDFVTYPEGFIKDGLWSKMKNKFKETFGSGGTADTMKNGILLAAKEYLPSVEEIQQVFTNCKSPQGCAEKFLQQANSVMSCLKLKVHNSHDIDDNLRQQCLRDGLIIPLMEKLDLMLAMETLRTCAFAMFVFLLKYENNVSIDGKTTNQLCRAMLILPDTVKRSCPDLDDFRHHFPLRMQGERNLAKFLLELVKSENTWEVTKDPSWLCCVPLLHFLEGKSFPFVHVEPSAVSTRDEWWGISSFVSRKDSFKRSMKMMTGQFKDYIELFGPAFVADRLFVRTIVASLDLEPLLVVLCKAPVPVEVIAASFAHHFRLKPFYSDETKKTLKEVLQKMKKMLQDHDLQSPGSDLQLQQSQCQVRLVSKMLEEVLQNSDKFGEDIVLDCIHLMFLANSQEACEEEMLCAANEAVLSQGWLQQAKESAGVVCDWVARRYRLPFAGSLLSSRLRMWGQLLQTTAKLTHTGVVKELQKIVADRFEAELKELPAADKIEVFVKQQDQVEPAFIGILSRLTFEALEEALTMKSDHLNDVRLVSFLTTLLEQKWKESIDKGTEELTFVLTWPPMVHYLQRYSA